VKGEKTTVRLGMLTRKLISPESGQKLLSCGGSSACRMRTRGCKVQDTSGWGPVAHTDLQTHEGGHSPPVDQVLDTRVLPLLCLWEEGVATRIPAHDHFAGHEPASTKEYPVSRRDRSRGKGGDDSPIGLVAVVIALCHDIPIVQGGEKRQVGLDFGANDLWEIQE
jgi:hypothetical protein